MKILILKGLPASGKSTFARKLLANQIHDMRGKWKRVNKDDLRSMIDDGYWSKENESFIIKIRDNLIRQALLDGYDVVVDDTNLAPQHEKDIMKIAEQLEANFDVKFFEIKVEEAIKRDLNRPVSVGKDVIMDMYKRYLAPQLAPYTKPKDKMPAIICDIDGTLAHFNGRSPHDYDKLHTDTVDETIASIISEYKKDYSIIIVSGRPDSHRQLTIDWLNNNGIGFNELFMRKAGDSRNDAIVKQEIFDEHIRDNYAVEFILDDRNRVVDMWRTSGITVLQVAEGNF